MKKIAVILISAAITLSSGQVYAETKPETIEQWLKEKDPIKRELGVKSIGNHKYSQFIPKLAEIIGDTGENEKVVKAAVAVLGTFKEEKNKVIPVLLGVLEKYKDRDKIDIYKSAVISLGDMKDNRVSVIERLFAVLSDTTDAVLQIEILNSFIKIGDKKVQYLVVDLLRFDTIREDVKIKDLELIEKIGDGKVLKFLKESKEICEKDDYYRNVAKKIGETIRNVEKKERELKKTFTKSNK